METSHISEDTLWDYIDGAPVGESEKVHLQACPTCKELFIQLQSFDAEMHHLPMKDPSLNFTENVVRKAQTPLLAFNWFLSLVGAVFASVFGLSVYIAGTSDFKTEPFVLNTFLFVVMLGVGLILEQWLAVRSKSLTID